MKYIGCKKCGAIVSNQYKHCPNCGFMLKMPGKGFAITSMILGIVACYYAFSYVISTILAKVFLSIFNNTASLLNDYNEYYYNDFYPQDELNEILSSTMTLSYILIFVYILAAVIISLCFGYASRRRGGNFKMAKAGIIMSYISIIVSVLALIVNIVVSLI